MNLFSISRAKEMKLTDVSVLSKKDRDPGEAPGMQLAVIANFDQSILNAFVEGLASIIFEVSEEVGVGTDSELTGLSAAAKFFGELEPTTELTGYTGHADFGMGAGKGQDFENAMLHSFKMLPQDGGSVNVKFKIDIPNCAEKVLGKFAINKSQRFELTLEPPKVKVETKGDAAQIGLLNANTPPMTRTPSPFDKAAPGDDTGAQEDDTGGDTAVDTPAKALARAAKIPRTAK